MCFLFNIYMVPPLPPRGIPAISAALYTNTILQHKKAGRYDFISHLRERENVQERGILSFPPSVCSPLSIPASFCSIYSYSTVNHVLKKKEREGGRGRGRNPEIADGSGIFFSCSYPSAFEPAMWKSARSTALHSSLPLIKSRQSGLNQHAKCHSTL